MDLIVSKTGSTAAGGGGIYKSKSSFRTEDNM
jgi:hypothetical protein